MENPDPFIVRSVLIELLQQEAAKHQVYVDAPQVSERSKYRHEGIRNKLLWLAKEIKKGDLL